MYQMLIEDSHNGIRYLSSIVLSDDDLKKYDIRVYAQREHMQRNPDDIMLDEENRIEIFKKINIIGLVSLQYKQINFN